MANKNNSAIWTDNEQTRALIWEAYNGYVDHYNNYMMYRHLGKDNPIIMAGLIRYANFFYEETSIFFDTFSKLKEDTKKIKEIFESNNLEHKDFVALRHFFNKFLFVSGIKNVLMQKDTRSGVEKTADRYQLGSIDNE